jgi:hypothetical protein
MNNWATLLFFCNIRRELLNLHLVFMFNRGIFNFDSRNHAIAWVTFRMIARSLYLPLKIFYILTTSIVRYNITIKYFFNLVNSYEA